MELNVNQENELNRKVNYIFVKEEDGGIKASGDVRWSGKSILLQLEEYAVRGYNVNEYHETYWRTLIEYGAFWETQDDFNWVLKKQFSQLRNDNERRLFLFSKEIARKIKYYKELDNELFSLELAKNRWEMF